MKNVQDILPLSGMQQGILFHVLAEPESALYIEQAAWTIEGGFEIALFERAWSQVTTRHAALRTCFFSEKLDRPLQVVRSQVALPFEQQDWRTLPHARQEQALARLMGEHRRTPFPLSRAPLFRLAAIRLADRVWRIVWTWHHLILDGWSVSLILGEVFAVYQSLRQGRAADLPPCRSYRDYAAWVKRQDLSRAEQYWRKRLRDFEPKEEPGPAAGTMSDYRSRSVTLSAASTAKLREFAQAHRATLNVAVQAVWAALLSADSDRSRIVFGSVVSGRSAGFDGVASIPGLFLNTLPVCTSVEPSEPLASFLNRLQSNDLEARGFEYVSLPQIQRWAALPPGRRLFESLLVFDNLPAIDPAVAGDAGLTVRDFVHSTAHTGYPLTLEAFPGQQLRLQLTHDTARFSLGDAARLTTRLETALQNLIAGPTHVEGIAGLTSAERHQIVTEWNDTATATAEDVLLHEWIHRQAERSADAIAIVFRETQITYRELDRRSDRLARRLTALGAGPETRVGICAERCDDLVVWLVAILKSGAAYVPLDATYPAQRVRFMAEASGAKLIVTERRFRPLLPPDAPLVFMDDPVDASPDAPFASPKVFGDNAAYAIFTSGSTGAPKAAVNTHAAILNRLLWMQRRYQLTPADRVLQKTPMSFDVSVWEFFWPLLAGATLVLAEPGGHRDACYLRDLIVRERVTTVHFVPSMLKAFLEEPGVEACTGLRHVFSSGEALAPETQFRFFERLRAKLYNLYGPTEAAVDVTHWECAAAAQPNRVPIGKPIDNVAMRILDSSLRAVPFGISGQLAIAGVALARGYLDRPDLTAATFIPDPYAAEPGARLYLTGDRARYLPGGAIEFLGRLDHQVKLRGFRIEPAEIEAAIGSHPSIADAVVLLRGDGAAPQLIAWYRSKGDCSPAELEDFVAARLPDYMVPSAFVRLETWPLSPSGKLDRSALPAPEQQPSGPRPSTPPRTNTEHALAQIWAKVLGIAEPGVHDDFFESGGDSILAMLVSSKAREAGIPLTVRDVFEKRTIAALAAPGGAVPAAPLPAVDVTEAPLTPIQRWFFERFEAHPNHFNQAVVLEVATIPAARLCHALHAAVERRDAFSLRFRRDSGQWKQSRGEPAAGIFSQIDLGAAPENIRSELFREAAGRLQASLDIETGPLLRAAFFTYDDSSSGHLLIVAHHLAIDGVSWRVLLEDCECALRQPGAGSPISLPAAGPPFLAWAAELSARRESRTTQAQAGLWQDLARRGTASVPVDFRKGANTASSRRNVAFSLSSAETRTLLEGLPRAFQARIDEALISELAMVLSQWTGSPEIRLAVESHGRAPAMDGLDVSRAIGWFTSMFPFPVKVSRAALPAEVLRSVSDTFRTIPDAGLGYGLLRYGGDPERRDPFTGVTDPEVLFNYLGRFHHASSLLPPAAMETGPLRDGRGERAHVFEVNCGIAGDRFHCVWEFSENLHAPATVEDLVSRFRAGLQRLAAESASPLDPKPAPAEFPLANLKSRDLTTLLQAHPDLEDVYHLAPIQEGLLFHNLATPDSDAYFEQHIFTLEGDFHPAAFRQALQSVVDRHATLRTSFHWRGLPAPVQVVRRAAVLPMEEADWRGIPKGQQREHLDDLLEADRRRRFDLETPPLLRLWLVRTEDRRWLCVWTWHHLLLDGWSLLTGMREVLLNYRALLEGNSPEVRLAARYRDYISWLDRQDSGAAQAFWAKMLEGFEPATALPAELGRRKDESGAAEACERSVIPAEKAASLARFARARRVTLNAVTQAAWACLLARWSGRHDVCFGVTVSCRPPDLAGSSEMIGLLINTVPVRTRFNPRERVADWLDRVQTEIAAILPFASTPLPSIQSWTATPRDSPLFESVLVFQNFPRETLGPETLGELKIEGWEPVERTTWPLMLVVEPAAEIRLRLLYDRKRFSRTAAAKILEQFTALLNAIETHPSVEAGSLSPQTAAERHQCLIEWNDTAAPFPRGVCYHHLFEAQVRRSPSALAAEFGGECLSYAELNARANRIARRLRALGAAPERIVGVCLERSTDLVAARLAVMKAGAAYLPLDPALPQERLSFMIADAGAVAVITHQNLRNRLSESSGPLLSLDESHAEIAGESEADLGVPLFPENLAYVIYTSGSTGRPKGVATAHAGFVNLVTWHNLAYRVTPSDRKSQLSGLGFDASVWEMWPYLAAGASVHIPDDETRANWPKLLEWMRRQRITLSFFPTPLAEAVVEQPWPADLALRGLLTGGDRLHQWPRQRLKFEFVNKYGPTEVTAVTTWAPFLPDAECRSDPPSIGRPIANLRLYILDTNLETLPTGAVGELYIGGVGLARCYHGRPDLTAEKFIPDPFGSEPGARLYRTGDLVRWSRHGEIDFLGRIDNQVKIRGFRIELGEIEAAIQAAEGIRGVAVLVHPDSTAAPRITAYLVPVDRTRFSREALQARLEQRLPAYMIPSQYVVLDEFPLTPNGKVDHRALPKPQPEPETDSGLVPPRTELERSLARIWMEIMGLRQVGIHDNFFSVGGDSIVSIRIGAAASRQGLDLSPASIFEFPTIAELAAHLGNAGSAGRVAEKLTEAQPIEVNRRDLTVLAKTLAKRR